MQPDFLQMKCNKMSEFFIPNPISSLRDMEIHI
jgi:hypothetical protein